MLTGGASTRMGTDKAAIVVDGVAMADRVAGALVAAGAAAVVKVGGPAGDVADDHPGQGPLGGVLAALRWAGGRPVVVAPCDLLAPDPLALATLAAAVTTATTTTAAVPAPDRPLPVALGPGAAGPLAAAFAAGERSLRRALVELAPTAVALDHRALADADAPDELPPGARYRRSVPVPEVDVAELARQREAGAPLIDVRQPDEWEEFRAPGAVLVPLGEVPERVDEIPAGGTVYVICKSGGRSARAVELLRARGIDAVNVAGGSLAWRDAGLPLESGPA